MNNAQLADHIVKGIYGRRAARRSRRDSQALRTDQQRRTPKNWVHAHINLRADWPAGYLSELVHDRTNPDLARDWQEYLNTARQAYKAGRQ